MDEYVVSSDSGEENINYSDRIRHTNKLMYQLESKLQSFIKPKLNKRGLQNESSHQLLKSTSELDEELLEYE
jgi:hypothetical protein